MSYLSSWDAGRLKWFWTNNKTSFVRAASEFLFNGLVDWDFVQVVTVELELVGVGINRSSWRGSSFECISICEFNAESIAVSDYSSILIWNSIFLF